MKLDSLFNMAIESRELGAFVVCTIKVSGSICDFLSDTVAIDEIRARTSSLCTGVVLKNLIEDPCVSCTATFLRSSCKGDCSYRKLRDGF